MPLRTTENAISDDFRTATPDQMLREKPNERLQFKTITCLFTHIAQICRYVRH